MSLAVPPSPEELTREQERGHVVSIGDLGGSYVRYKRVNTALGTTDGDLNWKGGARNVVYHGDILADRVADGFGILGHLHTTMRRQIEAAGGTLTILAGNHDDYAISFLTNRGGCHGDGLSRARIKEGRRFPQGYGLLEFTKFTGNRKMARDFSTAIKGDRLNRESILDAMRTDDTGKVILDGITHMNLCHVKENTLRVHTDPTSAMLRALMESDASTLNTRFKTGVGEALIEGKVFERRLNPLLDTFLATANRTMLRWIDECKPLDLSDYLIDRFIDETGIRRIIYGHTVVADYDHDDLVVSKRGLEFVSVDLGKNTMLPSAAVTTPRRLYTAEDLFHMGGVTTIK